MSRFYGKIQEYIYILYGTIPAFCLFNLFLIVVNSKIKLKLNFMFFKSYFSIFLIFLAINSRQLLRWKSSQVVSTVGNTGLIIILAYANNIQIFCVPYAIESTNFHALSTHTHTNTHRYTCTRMQCPNQKFSNLLPHITNITNIITNIYFLQIYLYLYLTYLYVYISIQILSACVSQTILQLK